MYTVVRVTTSHHGTATRSRKPDNMAANHGQLPRKESISYKWKGVASLCSSGDRMMAWMQASVASIEHLLQSGLVDNGLVDGGEL